MTWQGRYNTGG